MAQQWHVKCASERSWVRLPAGLNFLLMLCSWAKPLPKRAPSWPKSKSGYLVGPRKFVCVTSRVRQNLWLPGSWDGLWMNRVLWPVWSQESSACAGCWTIRLHLHLYLSMINKYMNWIQQVAVIPGVHIWLLCDSGWLLCNCGWLLCDSAWLLCNSGWLLCDCVIALWLRVITSSWSREGWNKTVSNSWKGV